MAPHNVVGHAAPDLKLEVVGEAGEARQASLSSLRGAKTAVLDFFAPWCKSCPSAAKRLEELATTARRERCLFLIVCVDGGVEGAREFAKMHGIEKCVVAAVVDEDETDAYAVQGLPHHVLIDPNGVVVKNYEVSLPADLDAVLDIAAQTVTDAVVE